MEQFLKISRPLFCDSNAFGNLSDKNKFNDFCEKISKSNSLSAKELLISLQKSNLIKEPIMLVEMLCIKQNKIFMDLENQAESIYLEIKNTLRPFINEFDQSNLDSNTYIALSEGLVSVADIMFNTFLSILSNNIVFSYDNFLTALDSREANVKNPSIMFLHYCDYIKDSNFDELKNIIINNLAIEAVFRLGTKIFNKIYRGNGDLEKAWSFYVGNLCINLKNRRINVSGYRSINTTMNLLNRTLEPKYHPLDLKPYNDLLDSYLIHWTTFGWFNPQGNLSSILSLTEDPYKDIIARIQQYQIYLAYEQNPIKNPIYENTPILFSPMPGAIYVHDEKDHLKYINIRPSICQISDNQANIKFNLEEEIIPL